MIREFQRRKKIQLKLYLNFPKVCEKKRRLIDWLCLFSSLVGCSSMDSFTLLTPCNNFVIPLLTDWSPDFYDSQSLEEQEKHKDLSLIFSSRKISLEGSLQSLLDLKNW